MAVTEKRKQSAPKPSASTPTTPTQDTGLDDLPVFDNVVLVRVRVKMPTSTKKDEFLTDKLCSDLKASGVRVNKDLFKLTDVQKYANQARRLLRERCVPWSATRVEADGLKKQDATWGISGREIKALAEELQNLREQFVDSAKAKADNYDEIIEERKRVLGGAYNPDDYPTKEQFLERFEWETEIIPLADLADVENDFRLKLPKKLAEEQVGRFRRDLNRKMGNVVKDVMHRLAERVIGDENDEGLVPRLQKYDPDPNDKRVGNTYRDVKLYDNIDQFREWVDSIYAAMPADELGEVSERLKVFCEDIRPKDPQIVRNDDKVRKRVIQGLMGLMNPEKMPEPEASQVSKNGKSGFDQF